MVRSPAGRLNCLLRNVEGLILDCSLSLRPDYRLLFFKVLCCLFDKSSKYDRNRNLNLRGPFFYSKLITVLVLSLTSYFFLIKLKF